jgi:hypothetical protein
MGVANNAFYIFDVGLYLDPNNTGVAPPWQMPDEAEELRACQRYWEKAYGGYRTQSPAAGFVGSYAHFLVPKRIVPAMGTVVNGTASGAVVSGNITTDFVGAGFQFNHPASSDSYNYSYNSVANARM